MSPLCIICNHGFAVINFVHVRSSAVNGNASHKGCVGVKACFVKVMRSFVEATPICKTMLFVRFC